MRKTVRSYVVSCSAGGLLTALLGLAACGNDSSSTAETQSVVCTPGPCQLAGTLKNGVCVNPNKPDGTACVDDNTCMTDKACRSGACIGAPLAVNTPCDDHSVCTQTDLCNNAGVCIGSNPVTCEPEDICHYAGVCDPIAGCQSTSKGPCVPQLSPLALVGCPPGDYSASITLGGTQTFSLIADSGSSTTAIAGYNCSGCTYSGCGASQTGSAACSPKYTPGASAINNNVSSNASYGDSSGWDGSVFTDTVTGGTSSAPTSPAVSMRIASMVDQTDFYEPSNCVLDAPTCNVYQGILGLGPTALASPNTDAFIPLMGQQPNTLNAFSTQLCNSGGRIWYGGYDPNSLASNPNFVPLITGSAFYAVKLTDLGVSGTSLGVNMNAINPLIVDTGTSDFLVSTAVYNRITAVIAQDANFVANFGVTYFDPTSSSGCVASKTGATSAQLDAMLPPMNLTYTQAGGAAFTVTMPATQSYLVPVPDANSNVYYCPGIASLGQDPAYSILGGSFMRGLVVIFDGDANQVGFAKSQGCAGLAQYTAVAGP